MIGVPSAPNATGAVLAMSDRPEAASGEKPSPISIAPVTATGVPKPDAPFEERAEAERDDQQLQAAVAVTAVMLWRSTSKSPRSYVSWYRKMTLSTIQPIGSRP